MSCAATLHLRSNVVCEYYFILAENIGIVFGDKIRQQVGLKQSRGFT